MLIIEIATGVVLGLFAYRLLASILKLNFTGFFPILGWITALATIGVFILTIFVAFAWSILDEKAFGQFVRAHSTTIYVLAAFVFLFCLFVGFLIDRSNKRRAGTA
jgi:hypothetical protein